MKRNARIDGSESPIYGCLGFIALILNRFDLSLESCFISDPPLQTLPTEDAQFDLRHIQPASVLWCVVKLQSFEYSSCHFRGERLVERRRFLSIQIIQHHTYAIGIRIRLLGKPCHLAGEVLFGAPDSFGRFGARGRSLRSFSNPSSTNRCRTRPTVALPIAQSLAICSSLSRWSALSSIRARVILRAELLPSLVIASNFSRSSAESFRMYLAAGIVSFLWLNKESTCLRLCQLYIALRSVCGRRLWPLVVRRRGDRTRNRSVSANFEDQRRFNKRLDPCQFALPGTAKLKMINTPVRLATRILQMENEMSEEEIR